jgi:soluble lytic murein transglycosylase-like protein
MTLQEVTNLAASVAPRAVQVFGGTANELAYRSVIVSAIETGGTFNAKAENDSSSARGLMQTLICTQRFMEERLNLPFREAMFSSKKTYCEKLYATKEPAKVGQGQDYLLNSPQYGVMIGAAYLAYQLQRYKSVEKALVAYNQGNYSDKAARNAAPYLAKYRQYENELGQAVSRLLSRPARTQPSEPLAMRPLLRKNDDIRTRRGILEFA